MQPSIRERVKQEILYHCNQMQAWANRRSMQALLIETANKNTSKRTKGCYEQIIVN